MIFTDVLKLEVPKKSCCILYVTKLFSRLSLLSDAIFHFYSLWTFIATRAYAMRKEVRFLKSAAWDQTNPDCIYISLASDFLLWHLHTIFSRRVSHTILWPFSVALGSWLQVGKGEWISSMNSENLTYFCLVIPSGKGTCTTRYTVTSISPCGSITEILWNPTGIHRNRVMNIYILNAAGSRPLSCFYI